METSTSLSSRECEVKFKISSKKDYNKLYAVVQKERFIYQGFQLETDFIPDTKEFLCRANGLLLRFRGIKKEDGTEDILLTLKRKLNNKNGFKDAQEFQYLFSQINNEVFFEIQKTLQRDTGIKLAYAVHHYSDLAALRTYLAEIGLKKLRILLQKKRAIFSRDNVYITFDTLPGKLGMYMEIEANSPSKLWKIVNLFGVQKNDVITKSYGDIMKEGQKSLRGERWRTALFD